MVFDETSAPDNLQDETDYLNNFLVKTTKHGFC